MELRVRVKSRGKLSQGAKWVCARAGQAVREARWGLWVKWGDDSNSERKPFVSTPLRNKHSLNHF